jgi:hypothetical protein
VAIGAGAAVAAKTIDFTVDEGVKTAFDRSALLADAVNVVIGYVNGRLRHR